MNLSKKEIQEVEDAIEILTTKSEEYDKPVLEYFDDDTLKNVQDCFHSLAEQAKAILNERAE